MRADGERGPVFASTEYACTYLDMSCLCNVEIDVPRCLAAHQNAERWLCLC